MHRLFELLMELIGWIQIALSPTLLGVVIGFILYTNIPTPYGWIIGAMITFIGLVAGIVLATRKFKTTGTMHFISRISATPELDSKESVGKNITKEDKDNHYTRPGE